jgi:tetratricopeptide (TPR) repeat protein
VNQAIRFQPDFAEAHDTLGYLHYKSGHLDKAVEALKQAIKINPDYAEAHHHLGIILYHMRRYKEAAEFLTRATRLNPDYSQAHFNLGVVYAALKKRDAALESYRTLQSLDASLANRLFSEIFKDKLLVARAK